MVRKATARKEEVQTARLETLLPCALETSDFRDRQEDLATKYGEMTRKREQMTALKSEVGKLQRDIDKIAHVLASGTEDREVTVEFRKAEGGTLTCVRMDTHEMVDIPTLRGGIQWRLPDDFRDAYGKTADPEYYTGVEDEEVEP